MKHAVKHAVKHTAAQTAGKPLDSSRVLPLGRELGVVIRRRRTKMKMEPEDLARMAGVDAKSVEYWESGRRTISNQSLPRVAHALAVKPSHLYAEAERMGAWKG